jgi:VWFA-related protein
VAAVAAAAVAVATLARVSAAPRQQDTAKPQTPTFRTGTNVIRVDVSVIDGRGNPVTSLTADDFDVRDDGVPQPITTFKLIEASGEPTDEQSLPIRNVQHAAAEAAKDDVRVFLVFWDEYHIGPYAAAVRAREALTRAMLESFGPTDLVALMDPLTTLDSIRFTRDRRELANQAHKLQGRRGVYVPARSGIEEAQLMNPGGVERIRCQVTESAIKAAAAHLGSLREGPNAIILISEGLGPCGSRTDESSRLRDLVQVASGSHTSIFVADPRGLQLGAPMSMFLQSLAESTGGEAFQTNDLGVIFKRAVTQASAFYLLGYSKDLPMDGKFHDIKVRVKRRGLEVRSRSGYWAPLASDVARAKEKAAEAEVRPAVAEALARLTPNDAPRLVDVWMGTAPAADGRSRVTLAWEPRAGGPNSTMAPAQVTATATSEEGGAFEGEIAKNGTSFEAGPGPVRIVLAIRNAAGEAIDRETRVLTVPDGSSPSLGLSTPIVFRARTPREPREDMPVYAGRDFERTNRVVIRFVTTGASREDAQVTARLLGRAGAPLTPLVVRRDPQGPGSSIDLPLTSIARGEFLVSIEASHGDERAEALVAFRVVR